eukprot:snap_masked-scaffold_2-processed-gene-24.22-mRNA-1 protein AED:1.00 eAED:1.00 QI:0/-1/0/0/-1/1/1/0/180
MNSQFKVRLATVNDVEQIEQVMKASIEILQEDFLSLKQIQASKEIMGLDRTLIEDGTYYVAFDIVSNKIAGCGGWGKRKAKYGRSVSHSVEQLELLDPSKEYANIRAMYTNPQFKRKGVAKLLIERSTQDANKEGFKGFVLTSTLAGEQFYLKHGFTETKRYVKEVKGEQIGLIEMKKTF